MQGFLLFSHGSLLCGAGQALGEHATRMRARLGGAPVEIGYLNYSDPSCELGVERLVEAGATQIIIVPYFLVSGYFVTHSLPATLSPIRERFPEVEFTVADALGADEHLADALIESAQGASADAEEWRDVYYDAAAFCRSRTDCPIYGTDRCPATAVRAESGKRKA